MLHSSIFFPLILLSLCKSRGPRLCRPFGESLAGGRRRMAEKRATAKTTTESKTGFTSPTDYCLCFCANFVYSAECFSFFSLTFGIPNCNLLVIYVLAVHPEYRLPCCTLCFNPIRGFPRIMNWWFPHISSYYYYCLPPSCGPPSAVVIYLKL